MVRLLQGELQSEGKMQVNRVVFWILIVILPILVLLSSSTDVALDKKFYSKQGVPYPNEVVDYFSGKSSVLDIPKLNQDELSHMSDVKVLINNLRITYFTLLLIYSVLIIILLSKSKNIIEIISELLYKGGIIANIAFMILILITLLSFTSTFTTFHQIFFPQGNWEFPADSYLLQVFPESFFVAGFKQIMTSSFVVGLVILVSGIIIRFISLRK